MQKITLVLCLVLASYFAHAKAEDSQLAAEYLPLSPKFIVNLKEWKSFLRVDVQLLIASEEDAEKIRPHLPAIRHALIMLFSNYGKDDLTTNEQREQLREQALQETKATLKKYAGSNGVKDLFFTEFLIQ